MGRGKYCYREVMPFAAMVTVECTNVGLSTLFKAASSRGLSYQVFIVYSFAIATLALLPFAFFFHRKTSLPPFNFSLLWRICLLAILGFSAQMLGFKGIEYSSPSLGSAISNLTPAFTFALAIITRMEKVTLRSASSQAKILGTIVSISGALVVVLYRGPAVLRTPSQSLSLNQPLTSPQSNWALGGLLLTADYLIISVWYIFQAQLVRRYPAELLVVCLYSLAVTIISAPVCLLTEPDLNAWKLRADLTLVAILYSGVIGSSLGTVVHTWGLHLKGPVYVALFRPLSIGIATIMGVIFLGDTLYLGSVIGAIVISVGFYVVIWGKAKEEMGKDVAVSDLESPNAPLLRSYPS
ncbi:WAT1-related protein At5g40230-like [Cornus florida]|uniref:WAT1-related protein At5g40230-like n=1 Tax=Cornus florida TaxID=4283 RepID=UPI00289E23AD|nr:WAT1-related protein At5g40230-like [Cornus florida]